MKVHHTMLLASMIAAAPLVAADRTPERAMANAVGTSSQMRKTMRPTRRSSSRLSNPAKIEMRIAES